LLAVELGNASFHFHATKQAKSEDVARFFIEMIGDYHQRGITSLDIFFDRNATHRRKMQALVNDAIKELSIAVHFHFMPAYSPVVNPTEYAIHQIRLAILHHADCRSTLEQFQERIRALCKNGKIFTQEQIFNLLGHIEDRILQSNNLSS
jgi:transposase